MSMEILIKKNEYENKYYDDQSVNFIFWKQLQYFWFVVVDQMEKVDKK